jgi:hypothetical protein
MLDNIVESWCLTEEINITKEYLHYQPSGWLLKVLRIGGPNDIFFDLRKAGD